MVSLIYPDLNSLPPISFELQLKISFVKFKKNPTVVQ